MLHTKSSLVEEAANELINMLLEFEQKEEEERYRDESRTDSKVEQMDSDGKNCCSSSIQLAPDINFFNYLNYFLMKCNLLWTKAPAKMHRFKWKNKITINHP